MSYKNRSFEEIFLKFFKFSVMFFMGLSLLVCVSALIFAAYQYLQKPKIPAVAQVAPTKAVNFEDFVNQIKTQETSKNTPTPEETKPKEVKVDKVEAKKYYKEAENILKCVSDLSLKSSGNPAPFSVDAIESFRKDFEHIADAKTSRGQAYVDDAVKTVCAIMNNDKVVELKKKSNELRLFLPATNFHLEKWDEIVNDKNTFDQKEIERIRFEESAEINRVMSAKVLGYSALLVAAGAFALFMSIALSLILVAIESSLRKISNSVVDLKIN